MAATPDRKKMERVRNVVNEEEDFVWKSDEKKGKKKRRKRQADRKRRRVRSESEEVNWPMWKIAARDEVESFHCTPSTGGTGTDSEEVGDDDGTVVDGEEEVEEDEDEEEEEEEEDEGVMLMAVFTSVRDERKVGSEEKDGRQRLLRSSVIISSIALNRSCETPETSKQLFQF